MEPTTQQPILVLGGTGKTGRRVTQRLLVREGYRVTLAKDGIEAQVEIVD